jgi:Flp pilus assembly protein TadD
MSKNKTGNKKNQNNKPIVPTAVIAKKKFSNGRLFLIAIVIGISAFTLYVPTGSYGLIEYDDQEYIKNNDLVLSGITPQGIVEAMSAIVACNWHPLTVLSHMTDITVFGNNPGSFHIVNALFHAANSILLFLLLLLGTGAFWRSCFVALIFAVHPLNVESVAWISERKNVLSTFFWFAGMLGYIQYVKRSNWRWFALAVGCCIFGLLAKPMLVTFPITILLLDFWPLNRFKNLDKKVLQRIILEKVPFFILSLTFCIVTVLVQKQAGAVGGGENGFPIPVRIANAVISIGQYLLTTVFPYGLSIFYPHPGLAISYGAAAAWGIIIVGLSALVFYWRKFPFLVFGWTWFIVTLVPVLGIVQAGIQARADRYMYVPMIGLLIVILWAGEQFCKKSLEAKRIGAGICILTIIALTVAAANQISLWKSNFTLFSHAALVTSRNQVAENIIGIEFGKQGNLAEAERHLNTAIAINNNYDRALFNLATVRRMQGNIPAAIELCEKVIAISPKFAEAYIDLGGLYLQNGNTSKAESFLLKAIDLAPRKSVAYSNLGFIYFQENRFEEAEKRWRQTLALDPHDQTALTHIGAIHSSKK